MYMDEPPVFIVDIQYLQLGGVIALKTPMNMIKISPWTLLNIYSQEHFGVPPTYGNHHRC